MRKFTRLAGAILFALPLLLIGNQIMASPTTNAHSFSFTDISGTPFPLKELQGKVLLIVNTASLCGFTKQYSDLQTLWQNYQEKGLVVIGVPSDNFGGQEYGSAAEIKDFCNTNFAIDFPLMEKTDVKGDKAHPFYKWAKKELGMLAAPKWNFHKYLVAPDGRLVDWFSTPTNPNGPKITKAIDQLLEN